MEINIDSIAGYSFAFIVIVSVIALYTVGLLIMEVYKHYKKNKKK